MAKRWVQRQALGIQNREALNQSSLTVEEQIKTGTEGEQEEMEDFGEEKDQPWLVDSSQVKLWIGREWLIYCMGSKTLFLDLLNPIEKPYSDFLFSKIPYHEIFLLFFIQQAFSAFMVGTFLFNLFQIASSPEFVFVFAIRKKFSDS